MHIIAALAVFLALIWLIADFIHGGTMGHVFVVMCIGLGTLIAWAVVGLEISVLLSNGQPDAPAGVGFLAAVIGGLGCGPIGYGLIRRCNRRRSAIFSLSPVTVPATGSAAVSED